MLRCFYQMKERRISKKKAFREIIRGDVAKDIKLAKCLSNAGGRVNNENMKLVTFLVDVHVTIPSPIWAIFYVNIKATLQQKNPRWRKKWSTRKYTPIELTLLIISKEKERNINNESCFQDLTQRSLEILSLKHP